MKTEDLNEYIFANLVDEHAQRARRRRQHKMDGQSFTKEEILNTPLTDEDIKEGFNSLQIMREGSLKLLKSS